MPEDFVQTTGDRLLDMELDRIKRRLKKATASTSAGAPANLTTIYSSDTFTEPVSSSSESDTSLTKHFLFGGAF